MGFGARCASVDKRTIFTLPAEVKKFWFRPSNLERGFDPFLGPLESASGFTRDNRIVIRAEVTVHPPVMVRSSKGSCNRQ